MEYVGALYHVMSRGDRGRAIVRGDADRERFFETLGETCERTGWIVHAYVLMTNHYHLLLETPEANLVQGMKWFLSTYTLRYNARYRQRGHVFQGRYKAVALEAEESGYTERVSTYIHLNPLRAGLVHWPEEEVWAYPWSSVPAYMGQARKPAWLSTTRVVECVGIDARRRDWGRQYARYLESRCRQWASEDGRNALMGDWKEIQRGWCLGGDMFRETLLEALGPKIKGGKRESYGGDAKRAHDDRAAAAWLRQGLAAYSLTAERLARLKKSDKRKLVLAWWLSRHTSVGADWISTRLAMGHRTSVSKAARLVEQGGDPDPQRLRRLLEAIPGITDCPLLPSASRRSSNRLSYYLTPSTPSNQTGARQASSPPDRARAG
ncbi:MAG: transposase [Lentisphaerae bacterium]|nr:transposase [Lentisphaerota bacterium]